MEQVRFKNYYDVLGVTRGADKAAVRAAYRELARKLHPDVNRDDPLAEDRFKEINEAYEVLSDPEKRTLYDRFGRDWQRYRDAAATVEQNGRSGRYPDGEDFGAWFAGQGQRDDATDRAFNASNGRFSDFFTLVFGSDSSDRPQGTRARIRPMRGEDAELSTEISLREAFTGTTRRVNLTTPDLCATCRGSGSTRGSTCPACDGKGQVSRRRTIEIDIPAGVRTGSRIRMAGQGGSGRAGGANGDVYLQIHVGADTTFQRVGDDLSVSIDVPLYTAVLGGESVVPTMNGRVVLTIPSGTQNGRTFRLRGRGMPKLNPPSGEHGSGDLLATVKIQLPNELSEREAQLFRELRDLRNSDGQ